MVYGIHPAAIFDSGKSVVKIKIKGIFHDKILHNSWSILRHVPGSSPYN